MESIWQRNSFRCTGWALALALALRERCGYRKACVAIAAKNARILWALLARGEALRAA